MRHEWRAALAVGLVTLGVALPSEAHADSWVGAFVGTAFGGATGDTLTDAVSNDATTTYGLNLGSMSGGIFGGEFDFGFTPKFFGSDSAVENSSVTTLHGSVILGVPLGGQGGLGLRPYGVAGVGVIRRQVEIRDLFDTFDTSDVGYNVGLGVMGFVTDTFGFRGEVRHFRNFQKSDGFPFVDQGAFNFSRASVGVVLRF